MDLAECIANDPRIAERFWAKVERLAPDECWPWLGAVGSDGYGHFRIGGRRGKVYAAHRVAAFLHGVNIDAHIRHSCDTPLCCNPAHHASGTHADNMADMADRGRNHTSRPGNGYQKIEDYTAVVAAFQVCGNKSAVARKFNVTPTRVRQIIQQQGL